MTAVPLRRLPESGLSEGRLGVESGGRRRARNRTSATPPASRPIHVGYGWNSVVGRQSRTSVLARTKSGVLIERPALVRAAGGRSGEREQAQATSYLSMGCFSEIAGPSRPSTQHVHDVIGIKRQRLTARANWSNEFAQYSL